MRSEEEINDLEKDIVKQNTKLKSIDYEIASLNENINKLEKEKTGLSSNLDYTSNKIKTIEEKIKEDDYLSYSGYTEQFSYSVNSGDHSINLQAALSDNEEEGRTHLYLGTPLVFSDF